MDQTLDRASGVLIGQACGDALGVPYELQPTLRDEQSPKMQGGGLGPYAPGEWSDETQMAICIAEVAVTGADLTSPQALDAIAERFLAWSQRGATDIDSTSRIVIAEALLNRSESPHQGLLHAARKHNTKNVSRPGNGALGRTSIVALTRIHDREATAAAARAIAALTHADPLAQDACILWCEAIRNAITSSENTWYKRINPAAGLDLITAKTRNIWAQWITQAHQRFFSPPADNTDTIATMQAAIGAIALTQWEAARRLGENGNPLPPAQAIHTGIDAAVRIGGDTDTVAAITGALLGGACGARALPKDWVQSIHGWPGLDAEALTDLACTTAITGARTGLLNLPQKIKTDVTATN